MLILAPPKRPGVPRFRAHKMMQMVYSVRKVCSVTGSVHSGGELGMTRCMAVQKKKKQKETTDVLPL